jgi:(p)ppGpp synthase/HD superfamily hydrolase
MKVREAIAFAMQVHEGQFRKKSKLPYIVHCISVYATVKKFKESKNFTEIQCAAVLHDTMEDCGISYE